MKVVITPMPPWDGWVAVTFIEAGPFPAVYMQCPREQTAAVATALRTDVRNQHGEVDFAGFSLTPAKAAGLAAALEVL